MSDDEAARERLRVERDERRRLAEAVHDGPLQHISALSQMLDAVVHSLGEGDIDHATAVAARALEITRATAGELRDIITGLEPVSLDVLGLAGALRELGSRTHERHGTVVDLDLCPLGDVGEAAASGVFQIAREAIDQAIRRGPPARIAIAVSRTPSGGLVLAIEDDAAQERRQAVLDGLAERAGDLNAAFVADRDGDRSTITVTLPPTATTL